MHSTPSTRRLAGLLGFVAAGALVLGGCSSTPEATTPSGDSDELIPVGMATSPWIGNGPWAIAAENGYFEDHGVEVTMTNLTGAADAMATYASGRVQMGNTASHNAFKLLDAGFDVTIVLLLDASLGADAIIVNDSVDTVADLKGRSVAYEEGSVSNLLLAYALQDAGLELDDIETVPMPAGEAATALVGGGVDAAVTYEPYISQVTATNPDIKTLFTAAEEQGLVSDVLVVMNDFLEENPEAVQGVINAWGDAVDYYNTETESAQAIIAESIGLEADALASAFDGLTFYTIADNVEALDGSYRDDVLPSILTISQQIGATKGDPDIGALIDSSFVRAAQ